MSLDKSPLQVKFFKGILVSDVCGSFDKYTQGEVPFENALEAKNIHFLKKGGFRTRYGFDSFNSQYTGANKIAGKPKQIWPITNLKGVVYTDRWLIFTHTSTTGRFYDTGSATPTTPILTVTVSTNAYVSAVVINVYGRLYISVWDAYLTPVVTSGGETGKVWVYTGDYAARLAGGAAPTLGAFAAAAAAGGNCTPGLHLVTVLYETDTGFITNFPNTTGVSVTTTAANATINFTNIPTGGAGLGIAKRHIIMTKIVANNDGQGFKSYEPFIALTINDNVTPNGSFNKPDSALVETAKDYLDSISIIPGCIGFATFKNRFCFIGVSDDATTSPYVWDILAVSRPNSPEQLFVDSGSLNKGRSFLRIETAPGTLSAAQEVNGMLYVFKEDSTIYVEDNDDDPSSWKPKTVDSGKGAFPWAITQVNGFPSNAFDGKLIIGGRHGIGLFDGTWEQNPISDHLFEPYDLDTQRWMKLFCDPVRKLIYVRLTTLPSLPVVYVINYYFGLDPLNIRASKLEFPVLNDGVDRTKVTDMNMRFPAAGIFNTPYSLPTFLVIDPSEGVIGPFSVYLISECTREYDFQALGPLLIGGQVPIYPDWSYESGYTNNQNGEVNTFGPLLLRVNTNYTVSGNPVGDGNVKAEWGQLDDSNYSIIDTFTPTTSPKKVFNAPINGAISEKIRIKISGQNHSIIHWLSLFFIKRQEHRPR